MGLMKRIFERLKQKRLERYKRMHSEILCAIAYEVYNEQAKAGVILPAFQVVEQRYKNLGITTPKDLEKTYTQFFLKGMVSGIEL